MIDPTWRRLHEIGPERALARPILTAPSTVEPLTCEAPGCNPGLLRGGECGNHRSCTRRLLAGTTAVVAQSANPGEALDGLIDFHLDFALGESGARLMAQATFGLLNSTPHSVKPGAVTTAGRAG
ncbi:hypothetical protein [Mycolicibacterium agri]|uniref:Uncharacterized protein n=1 Tax=Mycolicibacterium agri TaxID=36811 RepID=A0A7I9WEZ1_MYCAG|nr:hypothetical protein [Mycolicibacterium agri]GFG55806.1 hypothetical protein MAGR_72470 [Mycolicibacterium agri]